MNWRIFTLVGVLLILFPVNIYAQDTNEVIATIVLITPTQVKPEVIITRNKIKIKARDSEKLYKNDLLTLPKKTGLVVKILCNYDKSIHKLTPGLNASVNNYCPTSPPASSPPRKTCRGSICPSSGVNNSLTRLNKLDSSRLKRISVELKKIIDEGSQAPVVYRNLGELYVKLKQLEKAEYLYLKAIQLAKNSGNNEELTAAQSKVRELIGNK